MSPNTGYSGIFLGDQDGEFSGQIHYDHPTNAMRFATSGTERVRIDSSGNVGIGETSPDTALDVVGGSADSVVNTLTLKNDSTGNSAGTAINFVVDGVNDVVSSQIIAQRTGAAYHQGSLQFVTRDSGGGGLLERLRINQAGNVGIGTTSPAEKLDVNGNIILPYGNAYKGVGSTNDEILKMSFTSGVGDILNIAPAGNSSTGEIALKTTTSSTVTERVRIKSNGNVGIGTTSPTRTLDVRSSGVTTNLQSTSTAGGLIDLKHAGTAASNAGAYSGIRFYNGDGFKMAMAHITEASGSGYLQFGTNWAADTGDVMAIHSSGNIGIGTTSPSEKLSVAPDTDVSAEIGRAHIGSVGHSDYAGFAHVDRNTTGHFALMQHGSGETYLNAAGGQNINFRINNSAKMILKDSGNVGIGTTAPANKLDVRISNSAEYSTTETSELNPVGTDALYLFNEETTSTNGKVSILMRDTGSGGGAAGRITLVNDRAGDGSFAFLLRDSAHTGEQQEKMRITSDGNLGIGTDSPMTKLHVFEGDGSYPDDANNHLVVESDSHSYIGLGGGTSSDVGIHFGDSGGIGRGRLAYLNGSDAMAFSTAASERMRIDSSGNVGIGTSSPEGRLHIANFQTTDQLVLERTGSSSAKFSFNTFSDSITIVDEGGGSGAERVRIDSSGNVGIGTSSPSTKLDVVGTAKISGTTELGSTATGLRFIINSTDEFRIDGSDTGGNGWNSIHLRADGTDGLFIQKDTNNVGIGTTSPQRRLTVGAGSGVEIMSIYAGTGSSSAIHFTDTNTSTDYQGFVTYNHSVDALRLGTAENERMRIDSSGNVGIGTTSPSEKLEVNGKGLFNNTVITNTAIALKLKQAAGTENDATEFRTGGGEFKIYSGRDSGTHQDFVFATGDNYTSGTERARIDSSGNLLVGTTGVPNGTSVYGAGIVDGGGSSLKQFRAASSTTTAVSVARWYNPNGNVGSIQTSGSSTSYTTSSDARLKDDIGDFDGLGIVEQLNPRKFAWKSDGQEDIGLYAQEVKELVPNAVSETEDGYYQMDYSKLVTPLIKAVQELTAKVESLEAQLANK